jgi:hypothetical protein
MIIEWRDVIAAVYCSESHNIIQIAIAQVNVESYMTVSVSIFWAIKSK